MYPLTFSQVCLFKNKQEKIIENKITRQKTNWNYSISPVFMFHFHRYSAKHKFPDEWFVSTSERRDKFISFSVAFFDLLMLPKFILKVGGYVRVIKGNSLVKFLCGNWDCIESLTLIGNIEFFVKSELSRVQKSRVRIRRK